MAAHQAPLSLGFSRQEHWSGLPFPSPVHESEKWKWSRSVVSDPQRPHGLQPTRLLHPWDFPGGSTGAGAIAFSAAVPCPALILCWRSVRLSMHCMPRAASWRALQFRKLVFLSIPIPRSILVPRYPLWDFKNEFMYLFIWLCRILVVPCTIFYLHCSMWALVPWPRIELGPLHWEHRVLVTESQGSLLWDLIDLCLSFSAHLIHRKVGVCFSLNYSTHKIMLGPPWFITASRKSKENGSDTSEYLLCSAVCLTKRWELSLCFADARSEARRVGVICSPWEAGLGFELSSIRFGSGVFPMPLCFLRPKHSWSLSSSPKTTTFMAPCVLGAVL